MFQKKEKREKKKEKYIPKQDNKQNKSDLTIFRHLPIETDYAKAGLLPRTPPDVGGQIPLVQAGLLRRHLRSGR